MHSQPTAPTRLHFRKANKPAGLRKAIFETCEGNPLDITVHVASVYDGITAQLDTDAGRWIAVCELHGETVGCHTYKLALSAAHETESFCSECGRDPHEAIYF